MKSYLLSPLTVREVFLEKKIIFFSPFDFQRIFNASPQKTKYFLETYTRKGLFSRLKKGLYSLKNSSASDEVIANALYVPSYISMEYAMARHGIIPESVFEITSITTKPSRVFTFEEKNFSYCTIKKSAFTGYEMFENGIEKFLMADAEKSLIDYLYFVSLGKKSLSERIDIRKLKRNKLKRYARLFNRPGLTKLTQEICSPENLLKKLQ